MTQNKILALKYRPQEFKDLIGQELIAQTIINAIKINKTPNAYLLTGIRGVGKTTTARLIAKALNCTKNFSEGEKCKTGENCHCKEIVESNHMDVLEMDAASKTGIDDIRELIENSKYSPTSARFKIFIIDEVHMLSKQAFNGLLKTLEEPPPSLKFILATTEVRKIPVTILSRCQRFDLKRVSIEQLCTHLDIIAKKENGNISEKAIRLIARTSEGSVRDAISLLDRALIPQNIEKNKPVDEINVREMLGLADQGKIILLFKEILLGNEKQAINALRELLNDGLDAKNFLNDILQILYLFSRRINLGSIENDTSISETENQLVNEYSKNIDMQDIGLFWQLTLKTIDDLKIIGNESLALEMFIMQMVHLKNIEYKKEDLGKDNDLEKNEFKKSTLVGQNIEDEKLENNLSTKVKNQLKNTEQVKSNPVKNDISTQAQKMKTDISTFQNLIDKAESEKEIELKFDLERNVKLVNFKKGKIEISFNEKLNKNFIKNLSEKLLLWTGERWIISLGKNNEAKSIYEQNMENKSSELDNFKKSRIAKEIQEAFPDAQLAEIEEEHND
tara:strand:+ start:51 stop:1739 length:1689 start_codon:yes stop_codon:yes gene_type:complete